MGKHGICHVEWSSTDFARTKRFYETLFDWKFQSWGDEYLLFSHPDGIGGGFNKVPAVNTSSTPVVYIQVDEIEPYVSRITELGGTADGHIHEVTGAGWLTLFQDPDGNRLGLWKGRQD